MSCRAFLFDIHASLRYATVGIFRRCQAMCAPSARDNQINNKANR